MPQHTKKQMSLMQETGFAKAANARGIRSRTQPASGSISAFPADVCVGDRFLVECKRTDNASISIKKSWIAKVRKEAMSQGKDWCIHLEIDGEKLVVTPESVFLDFLAEDE